jgi:hypothetical protein
MSSIILQRVTIVSVIQPNVLALHKWASTNINNFLRNNKLEEAFHQHGGNLWPLVVLRFDLKSLVKVKVKVVSINEIVPKN